ncbi:MAG: hypothetical protein DRG71_05860 [Deltaproteobacteria bacterium]|nr:MAG: hypothetical protein DRG71_05860 [Deltaproteobacteria bacterium]
MEAGDTVKDWLAYLSEKKHVVALIQESLGCACPHEVFDHYQVRCVMTTPFPYVKMVVGERLLVYLVPCEHNQVSSGVAARLLHEGVQESDAKGLNRFRLALVGASSPVTDQLEQEVQSLNDSKVHLHVIRSISGS